MMSLIFALALQEVDTIKGLAHREAYDDAQKECAKAQMLAESDPKTALDLIEKIFSNPRINTKDRRLAFQGPGGGVLRTVDFFPHQAKGRIELYLAGQVKNDPAAAAKLITLAITDLKASVDAGVKSSEKLLSTAEDLQKKLKPVARTPDPAPPKETRKEPTKDTAAEQAFREAWFRLIEDHRFKSAREYIDVKGSSLAADRKRDFITETETHCQKYVQDAMEAFLTALHNTVRIEGLRTKNDSEYQREFALPVESEVVGTLPALDWCRRERAALDRLRRLEARASLDQSMPVLDAVLGAMVGAEALERSEENRWLKESWQLGFRFVDDLIRSQVATATSKEATPEVRRQSRASADQIRVRWTDSISKIPRSALVKNGVHPHPKQIQGLMDQFPVDPSDLEKLELDACATADSPDEALDQLISDLGRIREKEGARLSRESSQKLLTMLAAAMATRDLLAGKGPEEVTRGLGEIRKALGDFGGPVDPTRWGPKIEKILSPGP